MSTHDMKVKVKPSRGKGRLRGGEQEGKGSRVRRGMFPEHCERSWEGLEPEHHKINRQSLSNEREGKQIGVGACHRILNEGGIHCLILGARV